MAKNSFKLREEMRLIPWWSVVLAIVAVVAFPGFFVAALGKAPSPPTYAAAMIALGGLALAAAMLLVGYVNGDSKRRGMNSVLWTLLVFFVPNGIGFILYFLLRKPRREPCPQCGHLVDASFHYCPKCKFEVSPHCSKCGAAITSGYDYCPQCGTEVQPEAAQA
jgi:RNA polymerase subunit RPABC4/transcription elongation factor Spt4